MACSSDNNSGILQLTGPIQEVTLTNMASQKAPLDLFLSPRTTLPALLQNEIDDLTGHTCRYKGKTYQLVSIQLCALLHKGYHLPRHSAATPVAELILSFARKASGMDDTDHPLDGILLCVPIYESGTTQHGMYLEQLVTGSAETPVVSLQSVFANNPEDMSQTSLGYITCFETVNARQEFSSHGLYVVVFPGGIQLNATHWQTLRSRVGTLLPYHVPTAIKGTDPTLLTYTLSNGSKVKTELSSEGQLYTTSMTTSSAEFVHRFEYFTTPPTSAAGGSKQKYKTSQYKCVPFDQLRDLEMPNDLKNSYVIPRGISLSSLLELQQNMSGNQKKTDKQLVTNTLSTGQIETIIGVTVGALVVGGLGIYFSSRLSSNRS